MNSLNDDIIKALKKYPLLKLEISEGITFVKGIFSARNNAKKIEIESYEVLITFPNNYPYAFPVVTETSMKIPRNLDRHVKSDGTLCLSNWQDELKACKNGITFTSFLDEILNTHLCREFVKEKTTIYPTGERSHDMEGIWEGYYDILHTTDKITILKELDLILNHSRIGRNTPCYCDNGKKYKVCHEKIELEITGIGKTKARKIVDELKKDYEKRK